VDDLLTELGWSKKDLANRLGLHENTVYNWSDCESFEDAPQYAMAYLRVVVEVKRFAGRLL